MELYELTITQALEGMRQKKFSSVDITKALLTRIRLFDEALNAFVTVTEDKALQQAAHADKLRAQGADLPLLGIPLGIKDNFCTDGTKTTASSKVLQSFVPPYNATVVQRLKDAGSVMVGKLNMDAWAHGSSTETSDFGPTKNPWNLGYLPGGSSGGTAAAVAAQEVIGGIGSETAGSIRQPASWCGIVGFKPTYGRVSRYGVIAMASSLDSPGPMTKTAEDSARILQVIAGHDPKDATTSSTSVPNYLKNITKPIQGLTLGISDDYLAGVDEQVKAAFWETLKPFETLGVKIKKIKMFDPQYAIAVYTILQRSEVSSNLARYDGIRYGGGRQDFGEEAKRRIMLGTYTLSAGYYDKYYKKAQQVRTLIIEDFAKAFHEVDAIIAPTSPTPALPIGSSKNSAMFGEIADVLVEPSSIAGLPGVNVPCGFTKNHLPIGMQIIGPQLCEELLLTIAHQYEQITPWHKVRINLT